MDSVGLHAHNSHMKVRRRLVEGSSLLPPCGSQGSCLGHQPWCPLPLAELSHWPCLLSFNLKFNLLFLFFFLFFFFLPLRMKGKTLAQKESPLWRIRTTLTLRHPKRRLGRQRTGCMRVTCVTRYFRRAAHCWDTNMNTQVCQWTQAQGSKSACDLLYIKNTEATSDVQNLTGSSV